MVDWSQFAHVHEIPDYLNTDQYPGFKQIHENEIWIGLGNGTRVASIKNSGLLTALENVCRERPQVKLILCDPGDDGISLPDIQSSQLVRYLPNSFEEWADILLNLDIGLLPICGDYDLRLGRINLLEFMISKIPWLASNQLSFPELSRYGKLVQNSPETWEAAILKAVDNIEVLRKRASGEPFLFALSQDVNENIDKVLKLFTYILNQG
jgi:glycosyltransferase involved in cell wall biosynthesis